MKEALEGMLAAYRALALMYYLDASHETRMTDAECERAADSLVSSNDACQTAFALLVQHRSESEAP